MRIATWNVNSLRVRLPQLLEWLALNQPDVVALQEIKLTDDIFPVAELAAAGYGAVFSGQKTYNGVAILTRHATPFAAALDPVRAIANFDDPQRRVLAASYGDVRVVNLYVPNGQSVGSEKYEHRLRWLQALRSWLRDELQRHPKFRGVCYSFDGDPLPAGLSELARRDPPDLTLTLRFNRSEQVFEFMEPVVAEVKLMNVSKDPVIVDENWLSNLHELSVTVRKDGGEARVYHGFATYCRQAKPKVLQSCEAIYNSIYLAAGANGLDLTEPGYYTLQAMLALEHEDLVSEQVRIRITPPRGYDDEYVAQDFFSEEVARVMNFDGSRVLDGANNTLREVSERLKGSAVARHANIALAMPLRTSGKVLDMSGNAIKQVRASPDAAGKELSSALLTKPAEAAKTLGNVDFKIYVDQLSETLAATGDTAEAQAAQEKLLAVFEARKVKPSVIEDVRQRGLGYAKSVTRKKAKK
jgi:hypothetical protein